MSAQSIYRCSRGQHPRCHDHCRNEISSWGRTGYHMLRLIL